MNVNSQKSPSAKYKYANVRFRKGLLLKNCHRQIYVRVYYLPDYKHGRIYGRMYVRIYGRIYGRIRGRKYCRMYGPVHTWYEYGPNMSEYGTNRSEYVRICPNMVRIWSEYGPYGLNMVRIWSGYGPNVRICPNMSRNRTEIAKSQGNRKIAQKSQNH